MSSTSPSPDQSAAISLIVIEDSGFQREGLESIVRPYRDLDLIGCARDLNEALRFSARRRADVVVVNLADAAEPATLIRQLRQRLPGVRTLALLRSSDPAVARLLRSVGVDEIVTGMLRPSTLIEAIRRIGRGATANVA